MENERYNEFMRRALREAEAAGERGEVPVGAVLVASDGEEVLATSGNRIKELCDPTAHAEILTLRQAAQKVGNERLIGTTLYVSLEPCVMCAGAISFARVERLVFGALDEKGGAVANGPKFFDSATCHHRTAWEIGEFAEESAELLRSFFRARRKGGKLLDSRDLSK